MDNKPELILIVCEGKTEPIYFSILKKRFRLPTYIKILPDIEAEKYIPLGQHEKLIDNAQSIRNEYAKESAIKEENIETWAVCDRDNYKDSFTKLKNYATERKIKLAFSDPQFENYLLQHFSLSNSSSVGDQVEEELSEKIIEHEPWFGLYRKNDLSWLDEMIDKKHAIVKTAAINATNFSNHTKKPFFTIQELILRLLELI